MKSFVYNAAAGQNQWWRVVVTLVCTVGMFFLAQLPFILLLTNRAAGSALTASEIDRALATNDLATLGIETNLALFLLLIPFAVALFTLLLCVKFVHKRPMKSVLTQRERFDLGRLAFAAVLWFLLAGGSTLLLIPAERLVFQFDVGQFALLLLIVVTLMPMQILAEEVLFRGYLLQLFGLKLARNVWPLLVTSILFAVAHFGNPEVEYGLIMLATVYMAMAIFFGLLVILDNGLELAIGAHLANNVFAAIILSTSDGALNTASIFQTQVGEVVSNIWVLLIVMPVLLLVLHAKYRFDFSLIWKSR